MDAITLFENRAAEKQLEFLVHLAPDLPKWFRGDPLRLGQVLTNLVGNAIKFTESGEITVTISREGSLDSRQQLKFSVKDTGIGINPKNLEKLFEPFTQSDNSTTRHYGGTGLGLTISRNLVELMGGRLWAESTRGAGSTFTFTVWLEGSQQEAGSDMEIEKNKTNCLAGLQILLVEDNPVNRQIAEELLRQEGAGVEAVENGQEALDRIIEMESPDDCDMILMDLQMPVMDGFEATRKIRIINRNIPILAMTARTMADEKEGCINAGMNDHISKPIDPLLMYNTILKYVNPGNRNKPKNGASQVVTPVEVAEIPAIEGIDMAAVVKRFGRNQPLFISLLKLFNETQNQMAADLKKALAAGNRDELNRLLHTAKGILGNIGAASLYNQVKAIEDECEKPKNDAALEQQLSQFTRDFDQLQAAIAGTLATNEVVKQENNLANPQQLGEITARLRNLLEDGDSEALDYFEEYRSDLIAAWGEQQLSQLEGAIRSYDFDTALETLNGF